MGIAVVECAAVVGANDEETHCFGVKGLEHLTDREEITQTLGHFFVVYTHKAVVHPDLSHGLASHPFSLGNLVLVMRELQVRPTAVDVKLLT